MDEKKTSESEPKWLYVSKKDGLYRLNEYINISHISKIDFSKRPIRWLQLMAILMVIYAMVLGISFPGIIAWIFPALQWLWVFILQMFLAPIIGIVLLVVSVKYGKMTCVIWLDSMKSIVIPGITTAEDLKGFLAQLNIKVTLCKIQVKKSSQQRNTSGGKADE